tara:strand:+ start:488 stop:682 length:195 start_codon:yes stop_codon:yes gene_type:complete
MTKKRIKVPLSAPSKGQLKPRYNRAIEKYWEEYNDVVVPEGYMLVNQLIKKPNKNRTSLKIKKA